MMISNNIFCFGKDFLKLINGNIIKVTINKIINLYDNIKISEIPLSGIWYILLFSGYI